MRFSALKIAAFFIVLSLPQTIYALLPLPSSGNDFVFHGRGKLRLENISSSDSEIGGLYGETLEKTTSIDYRFFLEGSRSIGSNFKVGTLIRLSSEDDDVLLNGPVYLDNEYGSLFAQVSLSDMNFRLGYYDIFFTPLTLMRFDPQDLPELGGSGGCSSCTSQGGLIGGSLLEDIEEKLTFEGAVFDAGIGDHLEFKSFYARSQKPVEEERYRRHTSGAQIGYRYYLSDSMDSFVLSFQYLYHDDEGCSVDRAPAYYPLENHVGSVYFYFPVIKEMSLFGEWALSKLTHNLECTSPGKEKTEDGNAGTAGIHISFPKGFRTQLAYLYRSRDYESLYGALTYMANRQGGRIGTSWTRSDEKFSMDFFTKYLREVESDTDSDPAEYTSISAGVSFAPIEDLSIRLSGLAEFQKKEAEDRHLKEDFILASATLQSSYRIFHKNYLDLKYQFIDKSDDINPEEDYDAHVFSVEMNIDF